MRFRVAFDIDVEFVEICRKRIPQSWHVDAAGGQFVYVAGPFAVPADRERISLPKISQALRRQGQMPIVWELPSDPWINARLMQVMDFGDGCFLHDRGFK